MIANGEKPLGRGALDAAEALYQDYFQSGLIDRGLQLPVFHAQAGAIPIPAAPPIRFYPL